VFLTVDDSKNLRGSTVSVKLKNGLFFAWSRGRGVIRGWPARARSRSPVQIAWAQPRDRRLPETNPEVPHEHTE
jgi:hypothetical protein